MQHHSIPISNPYDGMPSHGSETVFAEKPYNMCLNCVYIGRRCDGPNFLAMEYHRLSEWCNLRKEFLRNQDKKWTNAYIADQAGLSKAAVDKFLAGTANDIRLNTLAGIVKVLIDGTWGQYPCAIEAFVKEQDHSGFENLIREAEAAKSECDRMQEQVEFLKQQIAAKDAQIVEKNKHLAERAAFMVRKDRAIRWLSVAVAVCVLITFAVLAFVL